mgnify:CR=1 FL=1
MQRLPRTIRLVILLSHDSSSYSDHEKRPSRLASVSTSTKSAANQSNWLILARSQARRADQAVISSSFSASADSNTSSNLRPFEKPSGTHVGREAFRSAHVHPRSPGRACLTNPRPRSDRPCVLFRRGRPNPESDPGTLSSHAFSISFSWRSPRRLASAQTQIMCYSTRPVTYLSHALSRPRAWARRRTRP